MSHPDDHAVTQAFVPASADDPGVTRTTDSATIHDAAPPPAVVPGYRLQRELGRGGMGVVYLATQDGLNRQVALKMVLSGDHASATEKGRFLAEAEAVAAVRHPGVVQVFDFGTHDGRPYFALEFLPGGSLTDKLKGTPLPAKEAAKLVEAIARAVQAAHDVGVIHRDLKPGNILFDADGTPKVTDFGLARKSDTNSGLTATGAILGTPSYMAPEQAEGRKNVGPVADVYAVGAILYECLTGRPPFRAATPLETIHQVLKDDPVPPSRFTPKLPRDIETVCLKCLSKDPRKRYPSAGAVADDLRRFLTGEPIVARPVSLLEKYVRAVRRRPALNALILLTFISIGVAIGTLTGSVKSLRRKQVQLEKEKAAARAAEVEAKTQRELAQTRLEKAIEAVDKMLTRVGGERWATNPALQAERQQVLLDAAAFFTELATTESTDPLVRREAAKAHARVAGTLLMANDLPQAETAGKAATRLYDGLMAEFPDDPDYPAAASEVFTLLGNMAALSARSAQAITAYRTAIGLAHKAVALRPDDPKYQLRVVTASAGECYFYMQTDFARGKKMAEETLALARRLGEAADAGYEAKVELAYSLFQNGGFALAASDLRTAGQRYDESDRILRELGAVSPPSARLAERHASTRAVVTIQRGAVAFRAAKTPDELKRSLDLMDAGLAGLNALLAVQPQAFPYIAQKIPTLATVAVAARRLGDDARADAALADLDRVEADARKANPSLFWIGRLSGLTRTLEMIERANRGRFDGLHEQVDRLLKPTPLPPEPLLVHNAACVCSRASAAAADPAVKEQWAARAVSILSGLTKTNYFKQPQAVKLLDTDPDLDPLRQRDDFKAFVAAVKKAAATPAGKEVK